MKEKKLDLYDVNIKVGIAFSLLMIAFLLAFFILFK